jgi:uncharacterized protein (DUF58 family)
MEATELLKKVRKIEIKTRGLSRHIFAGQYHSAFKGKGMAFSEVREYQYGDDIRSIDWNVTARFNHPFVKVFEEERELNVMLLIDLSASGNFGTQTRLKRELITEVAAVLSFSAIQNNDKIGVIFFSDKVEKFIPPKKGKQHILRIIRELIEFQPQNPSTSLAEPLRYLTNAIKKRSIVFVLSDFMDLDKDGNPRFDEAIRIASRKHDVVALRIYDKREEELPPVGLIRVKDTETGQTVWVDSSDKQMRNNYRAWWEKFSNKLDECFSHTGIDYVDLRTDEDFVKPLTKLFRNR